MHKVLKNMVSVVEGIAKTYGNNCEVVLHEIIDAKMSIVAICNGHVTGRSMGSPMLGVGTKNTENKKTEDVINYRNVTSDGKVLKSSTMFIRDDLDAVIGCLCINIDISSLLVAKNAIAGLTCTDKRMEKKLEHIASTNVENILKNIVEETLSIEGKPAKYMKKDEKINIVRKLDNQGAFLIKGAIEYVSEVLCVSRFTIYNYLDEIKNEKEE
ncbi:MAG: PAS domain-containing protein [Clostridiales bacterium]|nr:PAS domain-containing protein [Clostridiales bacterium]